MKIPEIAKIISQKIFRININNDIKEIGQVIKVSDGVATVYGLINVQFNELVEFSNGVNGVVFNIEEDSIGIVILDNDFSVSSKFLVKRKNHSFLIPVSSKMLGRVINVFGNPVDNKGIIPDCFFQKVDLKAPGIIERGKINEPIQTGIKAIDSLIPIGKGQRELIIGNRKTGKTSIIIDTILNQKLNNNRVNERNKIFCIYVAIGQKKSSIANVIKKLTNDNAIQYTIIIASSSSDPTPLQFYAPYVGCTIGEYFSNNGMDALIAYDDLSKHAIAYRQMSLLLRRSPGREAYPGDIFYIHSRLLERSIKFSIENGSGSLTALPVIETQESDVSAYVPTNVISITDGQIFLETDLFNQNIKPAINIGLSVSRIGSSAQINAMKKVSNTIKLYLSQFRELKSFSKFSSDLDVETKNLLIKGEMLTNMLTQPLNKPLQVEEQVIIIFTIMNNYVKYVKIDDFYEFENNLLKNIKKDKLHILEFIRKKKYLNKLLLEELNIYLKNFFL